MSRSDIENSSSKERVESSLKEILEELGDSDLGSEDWILVESRCQQIHTAFGGESPEAIYPENDD